MKVLYGKSVRVTSQAKKVPTITEPTVVMQAITKEFFSAWKVSGSVRTL